MTDFLDQPNPENDRKHEELRRSVAAILSSAEGRRVLFWVLEQAGIYRDAFTGEDAATNYRLGQQHIGRRILDLMNEVNPRAYPTLMLAVADDEAMAQAAQMKEDADDVA